MTRCVTQVGKLFAAWAVVAGLCWAWPAHAADFSKKNQEPRTEEVLSLDELMDSAQDLMPSVDASASESRYPNPDRSTPESKDAKAKPQEDAKAKDESPKTITAKKLPEDSAPKEKVEAPPAPYKVYPSPYVPDETPRTQSLTRGAAQDDGAQTWALGAGEGTRVQDNAPLPKIFMLPAAGMSRQFFPIFPIGAADDALAQLLPVSSNRDLGDDMSTVMRAVIVVHDLTRGANEALSTITTLAGAENENTLIIAPQFPLDIDIARFAAYLPEQGRSIARWPISRSRGWQTGEESIAKPPQKGISSFTAMDLLLLFLADGNTFPGLQGVAIVGHGMGGDFVQRYAAVGQAPDILRKQGVQTRFLVANASSYMYLTSVRPAAGGGSSFVAPDIQQCPGALDYPYGIGRMIAYARRGGVDAIRFRYPERRVMYLLSEAIAADPYLDADCAATVQGKDRMARGRNFERYMAKSFGEAAQGNHTFTLVTNAGYDPLTLLGSYCGMSMLFGDGTCPTTMMGR